MMRPGPTLAATALLTLGIGMAQQTQTADQAAREAAAAKAQILKNAAATPASSGKAISAADLQKMFPGEIGYKPLADDRYIMYAIDAATRVRLMLMDPASDLLQRINATAAANRQKGKTNDMLVIISGEAQKKNPQLFSAMVANGIKVGLVPGKLSRTGGVLVAGDITFTNGALIGQPGKTMYMQGAQSSSMASSSVDAIANLKAKIGNARNQAERSAVTWLGR